MNIIIQTLNFETTTALETYIISTLQTLRTLPIAIIRAEIILGEDDIADNQDKFCNIRLKTAEAGYLVAQHANSHEKAVVAAVNDLYKKIRKDAAPGSRN